MSPPDSAGSSRGLTPPLGQQQGRRRQRRGDGPPPPSAESSQGLSLPAALESERIVLGTLIVDPSTIVDAIEQLGQGEAFYSMIHRAIYRAIVRLGDTAGTTVEPSVIANELQQSRELGDMDIHAALARLEMAVIAPESLPVHLATILEKWRLRRLIVACQASIEIAQSEEEPVKEVLDSLEREVFQLSNEGASGAALPIHELTDLTITGIEARMHDGKAVSGIPTRYYDLDKKTGGFQRSDLIVLGARPSMGKTALAINIALNVALHADKAAGIFSMEMSALQLTQRMLAAMARVPLHRVRSGSLDRAALDVLTEKGEQLADAPLHIDDSFGLSILELRSKARRMVAQAGGSDKFGLIVIDYLQLMSGKGSRAENRQQEISEISRSLKALARELNVPILALSQLSRQTEQRSGKDKRPILSDLRESGAIEQDADVVMFVHREEYYRRKEAEKRAQAGGGGSPKPTPGPAIEPAEIILAKQRNGPVGTIDLFFQADLARFLNRDWTHKSDAEPVQAPDDDEVGPF